MCNKKASDSCGESFALHCRLMNDQDLISCLSLFFTFLFIHMCNPHNFGVDSVRNLSYAGASLAQLIGGWLLLGLLLLYSGQAFDRRRGR